VLVPTTAARETHRGAGAHYRLAVTPPPRSRTDVQQLIGITRPLSTLPDGAPGPVVAERHGVLIRPLVLTTAVGDRVPALYLTPGGPPPWPAVVAVHQHDDSFAVGKSEPAGLAGDPDMAYAIAMARLGVAALVPDLTAFEDRQRAWPSGADGERLEAFHLLALGTSLQARHVQDVALCVSWLIAQDDVAEGIGLIGHSLGGQVAFFAAACDERVRAAVISCGLGTVESFHAAGVVHNPAWYVPGIIPAGDSPAIAAVTAGQSFWISAGARDPLFPLHGVERAVAGFPGGRAQLHVFDGEHGFPAAIADQATRWLAGALQDDASGHPAG
jgi:dienelactone hydrolase